MMAKNLRPASVYGEDVLSGFDIQDWNMKAFATEIYDNIGQLLSLAKIQLATINPDKKEETKQLLEQSNLLLNRVIKDLRSLAKQLTPIEIMRRGFVYSLRYELARLNKLNICHSRLTITGTHQKLLDARELILFSIMQHFILKALYLLRVKNIDLKIDFTGHLILISIQYPYNPELFTRHRPKKGMGIGRRAKMIGAGIRIKNYKENKIITIRLQP
jgi:signal transduction histidine kinase